MKHVGSFFSKVTAYGVAFLITSLVGSAQAQQQGTAKVTAIKGTAEYSEAGGAWQKLMVGKVLQAGATIKTAVASQVDLFLKANGPVVRVTEDTTLLLDTLTYEETGAETVINTKLDLKNGRIQGNVKKLAAASSYQVKIPTGTVGIRGTKYDISTDGKIHCISGELIVNWITPQGTQPYTVPAGYVFTPATQPGQPPTVTPESPDYVPPVLPEGPEVVTIPVFAPVEVPVSPTSSAPASGSGGGSTGGSTGGPQ